MADLSVSGQTDEQLARTKQVVDAEIAARDQFPDEICTAIVEKAQELHGREIDPADVRAVLSANAEIEKAPIE